MSYFDRLQLVSILNIGGLLAHVVEARYRTDLRNRTIWVAVWAPIPHWRLEWVATRSLLQLIYSLHKRPLCIMQHCQCLYTNFPTIFAAMVLPWQLANLLQVHHLTMTWTHMALLLALTNLAYPLDCSGTSLSIHPDVSWMHSKLPPSYFATVLIYYWKFSQLSSRDCCGSYSALLMTALYLFYVWSTIYQLLLFVFRSMIFSLIFMNIESLNSILFYIFFWVIWWILENKKYSQILKWL